MSTLTIINSASPKIVRDWAEANGIETGARGKFSAELIKSYNLANPVKYTPAKHEKARKFAVVVKGKSVVRTTTPSKLREVLKANGVPVPARGALSAEQVQQAFDLANSEVSV